MEEGFSRFPAGTLCSSIEPVGGTRTSLRLRSPGIPRRAHGRQFNCQRSSFMRRMSGCTVSCRSPKRTSSRSSSHAADMQRSSDVARVMPLVLFPRKIIFRKQLLVMADNDQSNSSTLDVFLLWMRKEYLGGPDPMGVIQTVAAA